MADRLERNLRALLATLALTGGSAMAADIDALWDYSQPAVSETRFREALKTESGDDALELETQIARTYSMRRDFAKANALLDGVAAKLTAQSSSALRIRYLLERGRTLNSAGDFSAAKPLFQEAFDLAQKHDLVVLAIDAAHMFGFSKDLDESLRWSDRALRIAMASELPRARRWRASLANNMGSTERDRGNLDAAMQHFETALTAHQTFSSADRVRIAHWQIGNVMRLQKRFDEALAVQLRLEKEMLAANDPDVYVYKELAAIYGALNRPTEARLYADKANSFGVKP